MAILTLPMAVLLAFIVMYVQGIGANIMSLGGIAIAIGAMVDAVIIMIENVHKHIERDKGSKPHWQIIRDASIEVGPTLFYSLLVITVSFMPVFTLEAQEGRLFKPLAFTKTYSMAAAAFLSITLVPVLMGYLIRGRILPEERNPLNRFLIAVYHPVIEFILRHKARVLGHHRRRGAGGRRDLVAVQSPRLRVHAAALRRRPALHADDAAGDLHHQGARAAAADRPHHQAFSRGAARLRQDRPRRDGHRSGAAQHDGDHDHAEAGRGVAGGRYHRHERQGDRASPAHARRAGRRDECGHSVSRA